MKNNLLCFVAVPFTQEVINLLSFLPIKVNYEPNTVNDVYDYGLFMYKTTLELEKVDNEDEWVINDEDVLTVLTLYANKDFNSICTYLNSIPERPFNVSVRNSNYTYV